MTNSAPQVLIVEDEPQMRRFLRATLGNHGYRIVETETGEAALREATTRTPELVLLDLGLPDTDGIEVIARLREWMRAPIIVLSARDQESEKIRALDAGADDYLTKPFGAGELLARIRVALRHAAEKTDASSEPVSTIGDLTVDFARRQVKVGDKPVHLTPTEYKLLSILIRYGGKVITHRQLLKEVWGPTYADHTNYLRVFMAQLRHKLEEDPARPRYLLTEPGVGYRIRPQ
jgi:two-component system, OmpR family, KDP operon response regulator KdpE